MSHMVKNPCLVRSAVCGRKVLGRVAEWGRKMCWEFGKGLVFVWKKFLSDGVVEGRPDRWVVWV